MKGAYAEFVIVKPFLFNELIALLGLYFRRAASGGAGSWLFQNYGLTAAGGLTLSPLTLSYAY